MLYVITLALAGGLFAILTFIHFFVDWIFQSHAEAMVKHNNGVVRARHCAIYTMGFIPILGFFLWAGALTLSQCWLSVAILFISHFIEDTYLPVFLWAKHMRKPPEMTQPITFKRNDEMVTEINPMEGFKLFVQTPIGKILMIAIDQIIHLAFLFPIVWMVMSNVIR